MNEDKQEEVGKEQQTVSVISRRSSSYTTHYVNGCEFRIFEETDGDPAIVVTDFLFRSDIAGEPFEARRTDKGYREALDGRKTMIAEESLVGLAMTKRVLCSIAHLILDTFEEEVAK